MHISEGILSAPVLFSGGALSLAGIAIGLKKIEYDHIAQVGLLSAAFFTASLVHVAIGPASVHLLLNGLVGLLLGWAAFPAIFVGLLLQAVLFQFGGLTVLGVNTFIMAAPAVLCAFFCSRFIGGKELRAGALAAAFCCGFFSVGLSGVLVAFSLWFTEESFVDAAWLILAAHLPIMAVEGCITMFSVFFLHKVQPHALLAATSSFGFLAKNGSEEGW